MKKNLFFGIVSLVLGVGGVGVVLLCGLLGGFICGKPLYIINGANGPIPTCTSIFNTDFIWVLIFGICFLIMGSVLIRKYKKRRESS